MSTYASAGSGQRFADGFGRVSAAVSVLGLLAAVALSVPTSWFAGGGADEPAGASYAELTPAAPIRVSAIAGGVELVAPLVESGTTPRDALLAPPDDAPLVSWWQGSAKAGAPKGQTILTARAGIDGGGLTAIVDLAEGDLVDLLTDNGTMRYEVATVRTLSERTMDRVALTLFKQDGGAGRLVMISAQDWDGSSYTRSVVVTGTPLGQPTD